MTHAAHPLPGACPVCAHELTVTQLRCGNCATSLEGGFRLGRFQRLGVEQIGFLEVFIKNRGIIKDVEAELGISYPTVRARLDDLLRALGFPSGGDDAPSPRQTRDERRQVLQELREGRINADQAAKRLATLGDRA
ncbi:MAG: DUF2089 domain-containing protein [Chloroflexia bacterium]|nr:DUF2089 domain-containing protein [Chloroflexia bacterium]